MDDNKIKEERIIVDTSLLAQIYICALSKNGYTYENSKAFRQVFEDFLAILSDPEPAHQSLSQLNLCKTALLQTEGSEEKDEEKG